jgi:hypothetical protein
MKAHSDVAVFSSLPESVLRSPAPVDLKALGATGPAAASGGVTRR